jgi:hypothetical protein
MHGSLRKALIDSHVAAIAIAILLFGFFEEATYAFWEPGCDIFAFLVGSVAMKIHVISYIPVDPDSLTQKMLRHSATDLVYAMANLTGVWFLSLLMYGVGPLRVLGNYKDNLSRKRDA